MADVEFERFKTLLRKHSYLVTQPRMRLFGYLQNHPAYTLKELIHLTKKHDPVTVYRNIDLFEKLGIINRIRLGWNTKIELSDIFQHHHHHMSCVSCGKIFILKDNDIIEQEIAKISQRSKFKPMDHQLEIRGLCHNCYTKK
ncbi:MAG: Fur family transcriptional regulator [Patescibacteria group bacterium]